MNEITSSPCISGSGSYACVLEETSSEVSLPPSRLQGNILINKAKVIYSDLASINGIFHKIDSFLFSPREKRESHMGKPVRTTGKLCLSVCWSFWRFVCLSGGLSLCLSVLTSVCLSVCLYVYLSVSLSVCLEVCWSIWRSVSLSVWRTVCLSGSLSDVTTEGLSSLLSS